MSPLENKEKLEANLSLEATIVIVPVLIVLISFLFILYAKLIAINLRYGVENVAEEMAVIFPLVDSLAEDSSAELKGILDEYFLGEERELLNKLAGDYGSSLFLAPYLEKRIDYYLNTKVEAGGFAIQEHQRQILLDWAQNGKSLRLDVFLTLPTYFGDYEQKLSALVPLWSERLKNADAEAGESDQDNEEDSQIWEADNFTRGRYFREKEKANLPLNYPVIAAFNAGRAKAIKSMDLTAPSYQNPEAAKEAVLYHLQRLSQFKGKIYNSKKMPSIKEEDIVAKDFVFIVPKNHSERYTEEFFQALEAEAAALGINFTCKKLGQSKRYIEVN